MLYSLLDSGNKKKLELVGPYRLVRPALNAFWKPLLSISEWDKADGTYERNSSGGGNWSWPHGKLPESWQIGWGGFNLIVKPTEFGHLGFFAEQYQNWSWMQKQITSLPSPAKALNLFAYSGVGSMAMASAGAEVTHLDAAKGMNEWGQQNLKLNPSITGNIRWITDDVLKFIAREIRRGNFYNAIALDPPSFGRGPQGQVWKIEEQIFPLLSSCRQLLSTESPFFIVLSCHSSGFSPVVLGRILAQVFGIGKFEVETGEMTIPDSHGVLPAGIYARLRKF
jgi:23S rRNA (cytosine1962-C5)-methyltransferase